MTFTPRPGCPMCGIVSSALHSPIHIPSSLPASGPSSENSATPHVFLWRDDTFTVYQEKANPVSSRAHIIIAFNLHIPSIYTLSSTDLPLLTKIRDLARRILSQVPCSTPTDHEFSPIRPPPSPTLATSITPASANQTHRIGFITPPFRDTKIPVADHLHAHAYIMPADTLSWWRRIAYSSLAWYDIDDLIAEIRESTSNNRVRSAMPAANPRPIDRIPTAGARSGHANGRETTEKGISSEVDANLEEGFESTSSHAFSRIQTSPFSPISQAFGPLDHYDPSSSSSDLATLYLIPTTSSRLATQSV